MDVVAFLTELQDHLAPRLDTYEQAIYLYIFRNSRLIGLDEVVIGFKSARTRMAMGIGERTKPMSESTCREKLHSLAAKGCVKIVTTEYSGTRIRLLLPSEIPGVIVQTLGVVPLTLEEMDFFADPDNRKLILAREGDKCFYCLAKLTPKNHVLDHVVSRPEGDNSYRNIVAACLTCNSRKNNSDAEDYLRVLVREGFLSKDEFEQRLSHLQRLRAGELRPILPPSASQLVGETDVELNPIEDAPAS